jgi:circadian clock protein KaiC
MKSIKKTPTGIAGLDEITQGGFAVGRPTLVCGGPGCGKTNLAMEFLIHGAMDFGEPGLFVSFEEIPQNLIENFGSFGWDIQELIDKKQLKISYVDLSHEEIIESGAFTLDGLLIRLEHGISQIGAKRVAIDTMDNLFSAMPDSKILRKEVGRLFYWLMEKGITTVITGESGKEALTRNGFEEYVSDCVLRLDHRVTQQITKRRMRIVKYRGSSHGKDEYPFLISTKGLAVFPITEVGLDYPVATERVSTGVKDLDGMLEGKGYFKGSSVMVSGKAGTGKSSLAASFISEACKRGERSLYIAFEESAEQVIRNMLSLGIDLDPLLKNGSLTIKAFRPSFFGLEEHLLSILNMVEELKPDCVVMDPITEFISVGDRREVKSMLSRVLDQFKKRDITLFFTALTIGSGKTDVTETDMSSLMDTWIALDLIRTANTRHREIYIIKSRGMNHSYEIRELMMSSKGLSIRDLSDDESNPGHTERDKKGKR